MATFEISSNDSLFKSARDKVIVLTGGATGIGEATVRLLHSLGAIVAFLDLNRLDGQKLQSELGSNVDFHHGSVIVWQDQLNLFEKTIQKHGRIDAVIANAGVDEALEDVFEDVLDTTGQIKEPTLVVLDVNLRGAIYTAKLALSFFRKLNHKGSLTLTGSAASYLDTPGIPVYNAAKHGILGLMRSLRDTLTKEDLVRVNVVAPWFTQTPFTAYALEQWQTLSLPINQPVDVALAIIYLAVHTDVHGKSIFIAGGKYSELEDRIESLKPSWLGQETTDAINVRRTGNLRLGKQDT